MGYLAVFEMQERMAKKLLEWSHVQSTCGGVWAGGQAGRQHQLPAAPRLSVSRFSGRLVSAVQRGVQLASRVATAAMGHMGSRAPDLSLPSLFLLPVTRIAAAAVEV
jgi:hypothetical protein